MQNYSPLVQNLVDPGAAQGRKRVWPCGDFANASTFARRHLEHVGDVAVPALVGVAEAVLVRREIPFAVVLLADRVGQPGQRVEAGHPLGVAFDDHVEPVVPRVDAGGDGDGGGVREILRLLLLGARAEHERVVHPRPDQRRDVRTAVLADGGQPVQLGAGQRVGDLLPADGLRGFTETGVELADHRHTYTDRATGANSSRAGPTRQLGSANAPKPGVSGGPFTSARAGKSRPPKLTVVSKSPLRRLADGLLLASMRPALTDQALRRRRDAVDLEGKRILLTGASSGIGEAAAEKFARRGATVVVVARRQDLLDDARRPDHAPTAATRRPIAAICPTSTPSTRWSPTSSRSSAAWTS